MQRGWPVILALTSVLTLVGAACGRVELEDLTPEAVKTQQAVEAVTQTAVSESAGGFLGDPARGRTTWDTWCVGCHADTGNGIGPDIRGALYLWPEWEAFFRTGTKADGALTHTANNRLITYETTELNDENFFNVFAYVVQRP
jgi:cytochrome c